MKKTLLLSALFMGVYATTSYAQEVETEIPLVIQSGYNADLIAEKKVDTSDSETYKLYSNGIYLSKYADYVDAAATSGGYNAFYSTELQEDGGLELTKCTTPGYEDYATFKGNLGDDTETQYYLYHKDETSQNALVMSGTSSIGTLTLATLDGMTTFMMNRLYLMGTATEGGSTCSIKLVDKDGEDIGTTSVTFPDWYSSDGKGTTTNANISPILALKRITVGGPASTSTSGSSTSIGINTINLGGTTSTGNARFIMYKVTTNDLAEAQKSAVDAINLTHSAL